MKKLFILSLAWVGMTLASCNKHDIASPVADLGGQSVKVTAGADALTKVGAEDNGVFFWEKGDAIGVWTGSELTKFTLEDSSAGQNMGVFTGVLPAGGAINESSFAVYPFDYITVSGTTATISKGPQFKGPARLVPMYAKAGTAVIDGSAITNFAFKHLAAIAKFTLLNIPEEVKWIYVECYGTAPRNLFPGWTGTADLSAEEPVLTSNKTETGYSDGWYIGLGTRSGVIDRLDCYLPIVPDTYSNYVEFKIKPQGNDGWGKDLQPQKIGKFRDLNNGVKRGEMLVLPPINYGNAVLAQEDQEFLQALIDGNLIESAPASFDPEDPQGFIGISYGFGTSGTDVAYKYITKIDGAPLNGFPDKMRLKYLNTLKIGRGRTALTGTLPTDWYTPNMVTINICYTGLRGVIPEGFANQPKLVECYMDGNAFYGALPHVWNVPKLEAFILNAQTANPSLGYIVPATLDVIWNKDKTTGDKTQIKLGNDPSKDFIGFENGWGQQRWSAIDATAAAGNETVWNDARYYSDADYTVDGQTSAGWAWYYFNLGGVPKTMKTWNQDDADAYTAACKTANGD